MSGLNQQVTQQTWLREGASSNSGSSLADAGPNPFKSDVLRKNVASLAQIIESEIIPRLMLVHRSEASPPPAPAPTTESVDQDEINEFARLLLAHDISVATAYVKTMVTAGLRLETLYLDMFSPAARRLGQMWDEDLCDFTQVTMGLWRLQQLLHDLSPAFQKESKLAAQVRSILLMPAPGEQHSFGLFLVAEFFRRAGWNVWSELPRSHEDLVNIVRRNHFDIVGLSVAGEFNTDLLAKNIAEVRAASRNRATGVMVGGPMFISHPELVSVVGADVTAIDGNKAVQEAENLVASRESS